MSSEYMQKHKQSEVLAKAAHKALANGDETEAKGLFRQAAELEENAVSGFGPDKPRTLAILGLSASALYFKAGDYDKAAQLAERFLAINKVQEQDYFRKQLEEIIVDAFEKKYKG